VLGKLELSIVTVALGLSMLVFRPKWQERIQLGPHSAMLATIAVLILTAVFLR